MSSCNFEPLFVHNVTASRLNSYREKSDGCFVDTFRNFWKLGKKKTWFHFAA